MALLEEREAGGAVFFKRRTVRPGRSHLLIDDGHPLIVCDHGQAVNVRQLSRLRCHICPHGPTYVGEVCLAVA